MAQLSWWGGQQEGGGMYPEAVIPCSWSYATIWRAVARDIWFKKQKQVTSLAPMCSVLAAQSLGFPSAPSRVSWRVSVWSCIQTQSLQDEQGSWSDLLAQPAIFIFLWLCFIYFFTLCSITAGSLSSCPLMFSLSAKCQLSLPAG